MELRGLEPLTLCLQNGRITAVIGHDLPDHVAASDRDCPLQTPLNGTLMARDHATRPVQERSARPASWPPSSSKLPIFRTVVPAKSQRCDRSDAVGTSEA